MLKLPTLIELLQAGVHFGHRESKWHPKMKPFIFTSRGGIHIINLEKTAKSLLEALEFVKGIGARSGMVVFVGTKRQAVDIVREAAQRCGQPWVTTRWLGGTLTNFDTIRRLIDNYVRTKQELISGEASKYTKKERLMMERNVKKQDEIIGGVVGLKRTPDALIVVDAKKEKTAVAEARRKGVPIIALCDTNTNPDLLSFPIPANDDAVKSINLIVNLLADAYLEGRGTQVAPTEKAAE